MLNDDDCNIIGDYLAVDKSFDGKVMYGNFDVKQGWRCLMMAVVIIDVSDNSCSKKRAVDVNEIINDFNNGNGVNDVNAPKSVDRGGKMMIMSVVTIVTSLCSSLADENQVQKQQWL